MAAGKAHGRGPAVAPISSGSGRCSPRLAARDRHRGAAEPHHVDRNWAALVVATTKLAMVVAAQEPDRTGIEDRAGEAIPDTELADTTGQNHDVNRDWTAREFVVGCRRREEREVYIGSACPTSARSTPRAPGATATCTAARSRSSGRWRQGRRPEHCRTRAALDCALANSGPPARLELARSSVSGRGEPAGDQIARLAPGSAPSFRSPPVGTKLPFVGKLASQL